MTYDNGYLSETTKKNIENILKKIPCDSVVYKAAQPLSKKLNKELMLKMGEICFGCEMILNITVIKIATTLGIPKVVWGLSPSQIATKGIRSAVVKTDSIYANYIIDFYQTITSKMEFDLGLYNDLHRNILEWKHENDSTSTYPYYIYPYFTMDYDPYLIEDYLKNEYNWIRPNDTGGVSSNCTINQLHIYLKKKVKGFEFYKTMLDKKLASNEITLDLYRRSLEDNEDILVIKKY